MSNNDAPVKIVAVKQAMSGRAAGGGASGRTSPLSWLITGMLCAALGLAIFVGGVVMIVRQRAFLADARPATATIVQPRGMVSRSHKNDGPPTFEFTDGGGKTWRVDASPNEKELDYKVGQTVDVRYPPQHPDQAILANFDNLWGLSIFMMCISLLPIAAGVWTALTGWRAMQDTGAAV